MFIAPSLGRDRLPSSGVVSWQGSGSYSGGPLAVVYWAFVYWALWGGPYLLAVDELTGVQAQEVNEWKYVGEPVDN